VTQPVLELRLCPKSFAATQALKDMSLAVLPGEVHAIVGENGAGKSTLIKIMTGVYQPDTGTMQVDGQRGHAAVHARGAQDAGIAAIYQEPMVFPDLNVAENIFISNRAKGRSCAGPSLYREAEAG
jgi:rhamnose transport system ATP-binding protein